MCEARGRWVRCVIVAGGDPGRWSRRVILMGERCAHPDHPSYRSVSGEQGISGVELFVDIGRTPHLEPDPIDLRVEHDGVVGR